MTHATVTTPLLSSHLTSIPCDDSASLSTVVVEKKIERSKTEEIVVSATAIYNCCFCSLVITSLFAAPNPPFFTSKIVLQKTYHITLEAYVITALIGAAAQSLKLINNALQSRITDKHHLMIGKIVCCTPLLIIGCIMLADASAVLLAGRIPYVFVVETIHGATLKYFMGALSTMVLYMGVAALNTPFIYDKVCARLNTNKQLAVQ
jgi:hypothetical protein